MKILAFAGSLRRDSYNKKLAREAVRLLLAHGEAVAEFVDLRDYPMPLYDGDIERAGIPDSVMALGTRIAEADALVVATPEYNGSVSSALGVHVFPQMSLPAAGTAFDEESRLGGASAQQRS